MALNIRKMNIFNFLFEKKFYAHLALIVLATFFVLWIVLSSLKLYTFHNEAIIVPDYSGIYIDTIDSISNDHHFRFIVADSIYNSDGIPGSIVLQNPLAGSKVKRHRKIYLTIIAKMPEMTHMPNLIDLSLRQAVATLKSRGLKVNTLQYVPDFAENAVLEQLFKGNNILPDSLIQKGSKIDLILGKGYEVPKVKIPFLIGMNQEDACNILHLSALNVGVQTFLDSIKNGSYKVYHQEPNWDSTILLNYGDFINLWYRSDSAFDFEQYIKIILPDSQKIDSFQIYNDSLMF